MMMSDSRAAEADAPGSNPPAPKESRSPASVRRRVMSWMIRWGEAAAVGTGPPA